MNVLRNLLLVLSVSAVLVGCSSETSTQTASLPQPTEHTAQLADLGFSVANPVSSGNVKLIPIVSTSSNSTPTKDVVFLAEAKEKGYIEITEGEMSFNGVHVKNTSKHHILLMAGDLVTGGHQDRVIAHDIMIPPGEERDVEVFCVEQERSTGPTDEFTPSSQPVPHKVRREAMFAKTQEGVWSSVDSYNASAAAAPATRTVQGGLNSEQVQKHVSANETELLSKLMAVKNVTGYVLVVDGKIDVAEVFGDTTLFKRAAPQLLKSILAQQATKISTKPGSFAMAGVEEFLISALTGKRESIAEIARQGSDLSGFRFSSDNPRGAGAWIQRQGEDPTLASPRSTGTIAPSGDFQVKANKEIRGYELYDSAPKTNGAKGKLLHGTYAKP